MKSNKSTWDIEAIENILNEFDLTMYEDNGDFKGDYCVLEMISIIWDELT